ncbi:MAG: GyrI-like domain-containing protein [Trueperaceae bacterium]
MATKVDFKRTLDSYKAKAGGFRLVELPTLQYLMVDGQGDPNTSPAYQQALQTLYPVAYKLKFASKRELGRDYVVPPLEGLWWADDMAAFTSRRNKHEWRWTMMLLVPEWLGADMVEAAREQAGAKNPPARLDDVRLQELTESLCVQTLHVGSFDDEGPVLERMHSEFLPVNGLQLTGKHHEVYLSDFRKVVAQKLRTILRQPVLRAR